MYPIKNYLLSIATSADGTEICIHANKEGLAVLGNHIKTLLEQVDNGECLHSHLMSRSRGSDDLTETMLEKEKKSGCNQVHHVKLYGWTPEWQRKHNL